MPSLSLDRMRKLASGILVAHNTAEENALPVAHALAAAEADGQPGHGLSRLPNYAAQARSGKVDGHARPTIDEVGSAAFRTDARSGFAFPAFKLAIDALVARAPTTGIAASVIANSHHTGVAGHHVEALVEKGLIGIYLGNGPEAIAPWGGNKGVFGTNPIAFACPRRNDPPLIIDVSMSKVARGRINVARQRNEAIPEGWAIDSDGKPTTDPEAAMQGTMLPLGDAKGAQLVLMVEILSAALSASNFGFEASSFFTADGPPPDTGQTLIAIDPRGLSKGLFQDRIEHLFTAILSQPGTRLPGSRRHALRAEAACEGVEIPDGLYDELMKLDGAAA